MATSFALDPDAPRSSDPEELVKDDEYMSDTENDDSPHSPYIVDTRALDRYNGGPDDEPTFTDMRIWNQTPDDATDDATDATHAVKLDSTDVMVPAPKLDDAAAFPQLSVVKTKSARGQRSA